VSRDRHSVQEETPSADTGERGFLLLRVRCLDDVPLEALPDLLGDLERVRAKAWVRMLTTTQAARAEVSREAASPLLTVSEVAALLRFSPGHVYELVRSRILPAVRHGRSIRLRREDVEAWQARHQTGRVDSAGFRAASSRATALGTASTSRPGGGPGQRRERKERG
jgi:excisionase family DNA binding protein